MLVAPPPDTDLRSISGYLWGDGGLNARHLAKYKQGLVPHNFQPRVGMTVVLEEELVGREPILTRLVANVDQKQSCHLRAPRRYGKSSLMGRLAAKLEKAVMLELSDIGTLAGFLKTLLRSCFRYPAGTDCLSKLAQYHAWPIATDHASFPLIFNKAFSELMKDHDGKRIEGLLRTTLTALADDGIILLVDEFSLFLRDMHENDRAALNDFLEIFRQQRIRPDHPLVSVFAGSAGLSTYIELYGMHEFFADLTSVDVPPITADEARLLAEELFYGMQKQPTPTSLECLAGLTGNNDTVPYFVQALASYTAEQVGRRSKINEDDVEKAYYDRLLGPPGNFCFRDFILRERAYPGEYRACASPILKKLAEQAPQSVTLEELQRLRKTGCDFDKLMTCLEEDYDLVRLGNGWRMRSRVIADRWRLGEPWLTLGGN